MNDNIISALLVGGLIGGAILISDSNDSNREVEEVRMLRRGDGGGEQVRMLRRGDSDQMHLEITDGEAAFEFEGTISELENLDLEGLDEEIQESINNAIGQAGSRAEDGKIKIVLRRGG
ncbi:MAG: hypothetical protein OSA24_08345 [Longimicrobiales bacterium]|nr:hypothetical protein [Longimicrobiales bacterium]